MIELAYQVNNPHYVVGPGRWGGAKVRICGFMINDLGLLAHVDGAIFGYKNTHFMYKFVP